MDRNLVNLSKKMSYLLRHNNEDLAMDNNGYVMVSDLLNKLNVGMDILEFVVKQDNKQRYAFSPDKKKIRASQGHSLNVDVELEEVAPPKYLYHGTVGQYLDSILMTGLKPGSRQYVHLSADKETATSVGNRRGKAIILTVLAEDMYREGGKFYKSANGVWLAKHVDPKYIKIKI